MAWTLRNRLASIRRMTQPQKAQQLARLPLESEEQHVQRTCFVGSSSILACQELWGKLENRTAAIPNSLGGRVCRIKLITSRSDCTQRGLTEPQVVVEFKNTTSDVHCHVDEFAILQIDLSHIVLCCSPTTESYHATD
jgi:hypothetical protein